MKDVKQLNERLKKERQKAELLRFEILPIQQELSKSLLNIKELEEKIKEISKIDLQVSDHAIVRYFERVLRYNIEDVKSSILTDEIRAYNDTMGNGKYPVKYGDDEYQVVVKNGSLITVI